MLARFECFCAFWIMWMRSSRQPPTHFPTGGLCLESVTLPVNYQMCAIQLLTSWYWICSDTADLTTFPKKKAVHFSLWNANLWFVVGTKLYAVAASVAGRPELHEVGTTDWVKCSLRTVTAGAARQRTRAENENTAGKTSVRQHSSTVIRIIGIIIIRIGACKRTVWLPRRKDSINRLGGAADQQQRHGGQQADKDGARAQLAGAAHRKFQPSHHNPSQDGAHYCQWDTNSSWRHVRREISTPSDSSTFCSQTQTMMKVKVSHQSSCWIRPTSGWTVSQWTWPWRWRGRPAALPG